jgi:hypothetical protein
MHSCRVSGSVLGCLLLSVSILVVIENTTAAAAFHGIKPPLLLSMHHYSVSSSNNVPHIDCSTAVVHKAYNYDFICYGKQYDTKQSCVVRYNTNRDENDFEDENESYDDNAAEDNHNVGDKYDEEDVDYVDTANENEKTELTEVEIRNVEIAKLEAIEMQKQRAIQFWEESNYNEILKDNVHNSIMDNLNQGLVLPIFHTLCRNPMKRLFSPNTTVCVNKPQSGNIQLSSLQVQEGTAGTEIIGNVSMLRDRSYIDAFFINGTTARSKVNEESFTWKFNEDYTTLVTSLVNAPASMIGEDLELTKLVDVFQVDEETGVNLITRRLSRGVVADCFEQSKRRSVHAIVGSPGIGKSWTLIYALQQALLYENVCVVLCFQKEGEAIVCIRRNNTIYVWFTDHGSLKVDFDSRLFKNSNVLALLDPRESKKGGAAFGEGRRMLIMAASNNAEHFKSIEKITAGYDRFLSTYTNKELLVALPWMIEGLDKPPTMKEMVKRAQEVGNLPRYILQDDSFVKRQQQTAFAMKTIASGDIRDILQFEGLTKSQKGPSIPGSIFAVSVKVPLIAPNISNSLYEDYEEYAYESVGYDGQLVEDYMNYTLKLVSNEVVKGIAKMTRRIILSFWGKLSDDGSLNHMAFLLEELFWRDLTDKRKTNMRRFQLLPKKQRDTMKEKGETNIEVFNVGNCTIKMEMDFKDLGNAVFDIKPPNQPVVSRMKKNAALIDFAGPNRSVYQVTISDDHDMSVCGLIDLFLASGHCVKNSDGTIRVSENATNIEKIKYHWVVPPEREAIWKDKAPKRVLKLRKGSKMSDNTTISDACFKCVKKCLANYTTQYLVVVDFDPIYEMND